MIKKPLRGVASVLAIIIALLFTVMLSESVFAHSTSICSSQGERADIQQQMKKIESPENEQSKGCSGRWRK